MGSKSKVKSVDTNILVQAFWGENSLQAQKASKLMEEASIFVPITVILETEWVLRARYKIPKQIILETFNILDSVANVVIQDDGKFREAMALWETGLDFADALHLALSNDCEKLISFDKQFANRTPSNYKPQVELL